MKRCCALALALLLAMGCIPWGAAADAQEGHDFVYPRPPLPLSAPAGRGRRGERRLRRLKTAIDAEKAAHPDALLVDGGDFSIGSLIQTLYTTQAAELRTMGALGYDAATIGNHEFDHTGLGFAQMLNAAADAGTRPGRRWMRPSRTSRGPLRCSRSCTVLRRSSSPLC